MQFKRTTMVAAMMIAGLVASTGCKTSGIAVTERGQIMNINIVGPADLPDKGTGEIVVEITNAGVNQLGDVEVMVEMPVELIVTNHEADRGMDPVALATPNERMFHYRIGSLNVGETARIRYDVTTAFGTLQRTGDIKVTAWQEDLPGDRLVETKFIRLRH